VERLRRRHHDRAVSPDEEAVRILDLFGEGSLPQLTHGICPACTTAYFDVLHDPLFVLPPGTRGSARS
jgi:hypothetical protein